MDRHSTSNHGHLTAKVQELVRSFLLEDLKNESSITSLVDELKQYTIRVIIKGVLLALYGLAPEAVAGNDKLKWMSQWEVQQMPLKKSPFVHPKIQSLFLLLNFLIASFTSNKSEDEKKMFLEEELSFIELVCLGGVTEFSLTLHTFWLNVGFLYALLARQYGSIVRVRQLMYDMLYCFTKRAHVISFAILHTWPCILQTRLIQFGDPLTLVIIKHLTTVLPKTNSTSWIQNLTHKLRELIWRKHRHRSDINADEIFDLCFQRLHQFGVYEALVLLFKREGKEWFKQRPFQKLIAVVEGWCNGEGEVNDVQAVVAIEVVCSALKCYTHLQVQPEMTKLFDVFQNILSDDNTPPWMQEVVVLNVCRLSRLNFNQCVDLIVSWRPSEVSQNVIDQILVDIIGKRSPKWWASHQVARFYMCHR